MVKRVLATAVAIAGATAAAVFPTVTPAMAAPAFCDQPYYAANWARIQCRGGSGQWAVLVTCLIAGTGGHTEKTQGPWKTVSSVLIPNYADCSAFGAASPVVGSARRVIRG